MIRTKTIIVVILCLLAFSSIAQVADCPAVINQAMLSSQEVCSTIGRNQACYGHYNLEAIPQPDASDFNFANAGDLVQVATIQELKLSTLDTAAGAWGVVLMQVQANLPDTLPGQNVSMILFGDTELRNAATSINEQERTRLTMQVSSSSNANIRVRANATAPVIGTAAPGTLVIATGRNSDKSWIRIQLPEDETKSGWVSNSLLTTEEDINQLSLVSPGTAEYGPMQAFYFSSGIGNPGCNEVPSSGLLVQTPEGAKDINLLINGVDVDMGSTVFFSAPRNVSDSSSNVQSMTVRTIEGAARLRSEGGTSTAIAGTQLQVPLDDDLNPVGPPSDPESYEGDEFDDLPIDYLERNIEIAEPLSDEEVDLLIEYGPIFDFVELEDADEFFEYVNQEGDIDVFDFLTDELGYDNFDAEVAGYLEEELDFDLEGYGEDYGGDNGGDYGDDYEGEYGNDYGGDYGDDYGDEYDDDYGEDYGDDYGGDYGDDYGDEGEDYGY